MHLWSSSLHSRSIACQSPESKLISGTRCGAGLWLTFTGGDRILGSRGRGSPMKFNGSRLFAGLTLLTMAPVLLTLSVSAQQPQNAPPEDVVRVNTDLVQSAITVVDKDGHFVEGLRQDQFELLIDGKPRPISFLERVMAGSFREHQAWAARDSSAPDTTTSRNLTDRGRTIVFFIDDLHLEPDSLHRTRD